ncbi:MAG: pyridoxal phosphate-dependent aminotransferase [Gammaproteobacteria bacterium]|nr:pyridoxal phosphate-dependent aminotransferase [Gammaproteobacteria bacterium]
MTILTVSERGQQVIASPIRKFLPLMQEAQKRGITVHQLNTGDPDLYTPDAFFDAVKSYASRNLHYAPSPGISAHVSAWIQYYQQFDVILEPKNIIPTVGCAEAILLALLAVADVGDEILVFEPLYVSYTSFATMIRVKLIPVTLQNSDGFALPDISIIENKITTKTKAIVIINPDNPTGKLWSNDELKLIITLAKKHHLFIIADETYREIRFHGEASSLLSFQDARDHIILVDSISKRFSMPGARIGCIVSYNDSVMTAVLKFAQARLSVGTLEQHALIPLLENSKKYTDPVREEYHRRRDIVYDALSSMPGVIASRPEGAFYIYASLPVDSAENFVKFLIRDFNDQGETVMLSPMSDFYITQNLGHNEIRIAYVLNSDLLKRAMAILQKALKVYSAKNIENQNQDILNAVI